MRESYKRFVKTWIRFANPWICFNLICQFSKDSFHGFVSLCNFQKIRFVDSFCVAIFKRFDKSYKSSRILGTIGQTNPSESSGFQKICFVDSFRPTAFKRFVSWIRFVTQFSKIKNLKLLDSFCIGRIRVRIPHPQIKLIRIDNSKNTLSYLLCVLICLLIIISVVILIGLSLSQSDHILWLPLYFISMSQKLQNSTDRQKDRKAKRQKDRGTK